MPLARAPHVNIDRARFFALTVAIQSAACAAASEAEAPNRVAQGLTAVCSADGDDPAPIAAKRCIEIHGKAVDQGSPFADVARERCTTFATKFKTSFALDALSCLDKSTFGSVKEIYDCGVNALAKACPNQAEAVETCKAIEEVRASKGAPLTEADKVECFIAAGGLRPAGRAFLVGAADEGHASFGMLAASQGPPPSFDDWTFCPQGEACDVKCPTAESCD